SDLQNDPEFARLPPETQEYVKGRLAELDAYRTYKEQLAQVRSPAEARSLDDLTDIERTLRDELQPPTTYQAEWRQTDAAQLRDKWLDDVKALRKAANEVEDWYRQLAAKGNRPLLFADRTAEAAPLHWAQWLDGVESLAREAAAPSFRRGDRLRESRTAAGPPAAR